jgi:TonB family protein
MIHAQSLQSPKPSDAKVAAYPTCVSCPDPPLTRSKRLQHAEGFVVLDATITKAGRAEQIEVTKGLETGLAVRALSALRRWRFRPAIGNDGKPTAVRTVVLVTFGLRKKVRGIATG